MENTGKVLFDDDSAPRWFVATGEHWVGPLTAAEIYEKIIAGELTWAHFVWKAGQPDWKRICDTPEFQAAVPHQPARSIQMEVKAAAKPGSGTGGNSAAPTVRKASRGGPPPAPSVEAERKTWYLHYNSSQFGPFGESGFRRFLRIGKINGRVHAWRDGMKGWERLEQLEGFEGDVAAAEKIRTVKKARKTAKELRSSPRRPLVARTLMAQGESVFVAICRDISLGGMQVLTDRIPGQPGARLKLNVSPSGESLSGRNIEPFVAEGVIVRILEDGRGFSFRFERLGEGARKAIEEYIAAAG